MNKSTIKIGQPEQINNNESAAQNQQVSPSIANAVLAAVPLPCPFCGCSDNPVKKNTRVFHGAKGRYEEVDYYLECDGCGLVIGNDKNYDQWGDVVCDYSTPEEALNVWNSRHGS